MTAGITVAGRGSSRDAAVVRPNLLDIENLVVRFELPTETVDAVLGPDSGGLPDPAWKWWVLPPGLLIMLASLGFALIAFSLEERINPRL